MAGILDQVAHLPDRLLQSDRQGPGHDGVADVQFLHALDGGDRFDVGIGEAVAGIDPEPQLPGDHGGFLEPGPFSRLLIPAGLGVTPCVEFDPACPGGSAGIELGTVGVHEQTHADALLLETVDQGGDRVQLAGHIQPPFGGHLLPALRHQGHHVGADPEGDRGHGPCGRHLQVETGADGLPEQAHVTVLDVTAVLAEMHRDAVGPPEFSQQGMGDRVGFHRPSGLTDLGDVVDVDPEAGHGEVGVAGTLSVRQQQPAAGSTARPPTARSAEGP